MDDAVACCSVPISGASKYSIRGTMLPCFKHWMILELRQCLGDLSSGILLRFDLWRILELHQCWGILVICAIHSCRMLKFRSSIFCGMWWWSPWQWWCENIHSWISLSGDLALSHQDGFYGFKFPKRFWRSLPEISLFSQSESSKDLITNPLVPVPFAFARLNALQAAVKYSHSLSDPSSLLSYKGKSKTDCV
jgi:hypothetical protein